MMGGIGIVGTHHIALATANFGRLLEFYTATLGLPVLGGLADERIVFLGAGTTAIEVAEVAAVGDSGSGGWAHIALEVTDLDAACAVLIARGVSFRSPPEGYPAETPAMRIAFCTDPDGNLIELIQPLAERYPAL